MKKGDKKICVIGHIFYKSSECPICPTCEKQRTAPSPFHNIIAAPARRALENHGIYTIEQLAKYSEKEVLKFHGMGKSSIPKLKKVLSENGFSFK
jgi:predicted RecB family nuclease